MSGAACWDCDGLLSAGLTVFSALPQSGVLGSGGGRPDGGARGALLRSAGLHRRLPLAPTERSQCAGRRARAESRSVSPADHSAGQVRYVRNATPRVRDNCRADAATNGDKQACSATFLYFSKYFSSLPEKRSLLQMPRYDDLSFCRYSLVYWGFRARRQLCKVILRPQMYSMSNVDTLHTPRKL